MREFLENWPALILGIGIGVSFISFWFLYDRKIRRFLIILLIGLILSFTGVCNSSGNYPDGKNKSLDQSRGLFFKA